MRPLFFCVLCVLGDASASAAQSAPPAQTESRAEILFGIEERRDRFQYHFTNDSSYDTSFLVPHFFEQRYIMDNVWGVVTIRYTAGARWETSVGATTQRTATADDYDTFFNPDGVVWVSGTTGGASVRSFRVSQQAGLGRAGPVQLVGGYRLRIDLADFQLGHKTATRNGTLVLATDVTSPETASSQLRELFVGAVASLDVSAQWRVTLAGETSPLSLGRLLIRLPEKYPGQDLIFAARVITGSARVTLARHHVRWPIEVSFDVGRSWRYSSENRLAYQQLGARVGVGRAWQ